MKILISIAGVLTIINLASADPFPDTLWTKVYGDTASKVAETMVETQDGGFVLVGYTCSYSSSADVYMVEN